MLDDSHENSDHSFQSPDVPNVPPSPNNVPFPSSLDHQVTTVMGEPRSFYSVLSQLTSIDSESSSSKLTSSDKLSALPSQPPSNWARLRGVGRKLRRDPGSSVSLPSIDSPGMQLHQLPRASDSDGSAGKETPKRVSFDSERGSVPATLQSIRQVISGRVHGRTDSVAQSVRSGESPATQSHTNSPRPPDAPPAFSRNSSPSRAASPLRRFGWGLSRAHSRDEPFTPVDPWEVRLRRFISPTSTPRRASLDLEVDCEDQFSTCIPLPVQCSSARSKFRKFSSVIVPFFTDTLPRQIYLHLLLRLPSLYFSRVVRIFEEAEVSKQEIQKMIDACAPDVDFDPAIEEFRGRRTMSPAGTMRGKTEPQRAFLPFPEEWNPPTVSPALARFKQSWEQFVDSLMREWKTLNLVSALLCTAILTMFQVPEAAGDPLTRWAAILSLIFALMSLTYGIVFIIQFGTMRSMYKASRWAEEAQRTTTFIWWNIWVLLAAPAIWLGWSMIAFCVAILSFVWRTGSESDPSDGIRPPLSDTQAIIIRVVATVVFALGLLNFTMIMRTFGAYGESESGRKMRWKLRLHQHRHANTESERRPESDDERQSKRGRAFRRDTKRHGGVMGLGLSGLGGRDTVDDSDLYAEGHGAEKKSKGLVRDDIYPVPTVGMKISPKL